MLVVHSWPDSIKFKEWINQYALDLRVLTDEYIEQGIKDAIQHLTLVCNEHTPTLDRRRRSTKFLAEIGQIPREEHREMSTQAIDEDTGGTRGQDRFKNTLAEKYHEAQFKLFDLEKVLDTYDHVGTKLKRKSDGHQLSTDEFCTLIAQLIRKWHQCVVECEKVSANKSIDAMNDEYETDLLRLQSAVPVVLGRYQSQHLCENHLEDEKGWKCWRDHTVVLISFALYCAVVDSYLHKRFDKCGFDSMMERGE